MALHPLLSVLLFSTLLPTAPTASSTPINASTISSLKTICQSTPYPTSCLDSLKLSITISINPSILSFALHALQTSISEAIKLTSLLSSTTLIQKQKTALQDCQELHQLTISSLEKSAELIQSTDGSMQRKISDARTHLSAALTNKNTCLDGLAAAEGPEKARLVQTWLDTYSHVSNSLSLVSRGGGGNGVKGRRLKESFPEWMERKDRLLLQKNEYGEYDPALVITVAADGGGNFTTITDAINFAPNNSDDRTIIQVYAGVYEENVEVPVSKTNILILGEGSDVTVIRGNRSVRDGWTTFRSATVGVSGQGFLARDIAFENIAGPAKGQAVALRINADLCAIFRCSISGYQDTLYVHSFRQFYRDCDIYGTVDFIFGNAAVVLQNCNLFARLPMPTQSNIITAQSRDDPNEITGISIQNCSVVPSDDLAMSNKSIKTYLGRPWRNYSTTVFMESYIDSIVNPEGWRRWAAGNDQGLDTVYYGEYMNSGTGAETGGRVSWPGFHLMDYDDAYNFTVSEFIYGDEWLDSTSFPYDDGV